MYVYLLYFLLSNYHSFKLRCLPYSKYAIAMKKKRKYRIYVRGNTLMRTRRFAVVFLSRHTRNCIYNKIIAMIDD